MRVFLAGATGVIGQRLVPLLVRRGHEVTGTTRSPAKAAGLAARGAVPVVVDVLDASALAQALAAARPDAVIHQLTDLPSGPGTPGYEEGQKRNSRLRREGTRNLIDASKRAGAQRVVAQSVAFLYAPGATPHDEADPLDTHAEGTRALTIAGVTALEDAVLNTPPFAGLVLRYGYFYGLGTWNETAPRAPSVHADAAAHAALLALERGRPGIYNIAEDDSAVSTAKARADLGFDPTIRLDQ
ncbi:MAG: NAD(P)H-binding protein [Methylobacteriaceae bacterium]|nr:NAD(P)H-binding protein [Methylobacteriaceae bacterium]